MAFWKWGVVRARNEHKARSRSVLQQAKQHALATQRVRPRLPGQVRGRMRQPGANCPHRLRRAVPGPEMDLDAHQCANAGVGRGCHVQKFRRMPVMLQIVTTWVSLGLNGKKRDVYRHQRR
jgi:hypothetical protein